VKGLDAGADDYLTKPFSLANCLARVRALGRRVVSKTPECPEVGDLVLDVSTFRAFRTAANLSFAHGIQAFWNSLPEILAVSSQADNSGCTLGLPCGN